MLAPRRLLPILLVVLTLPACGRIERMTAPTNAAGLARPNSSGPVTVGGGITLHALTADGRLVSFDPGAPGELLGNLKVTGLSGPATRLLAIDFRPATGQLYGLGNDSRIYTVDPATGVANAVGAPFTPALAGSAFGFDFNPTVDRIRIVSDAGQNLRAHPVTGAVVAVDGALAFAAADANSGASPAVVGAGYTNNDNDAATGTTLYDIDADLDVLVTQVPPNSGTLNTLGPLGVDAGALCGFDIATVGTANSAYAAFKSPGAGGSADDDPRSRTIVDSATHLLQIDLATGAASDLGRIAGAGRILGLAARVN